MRNSLKALFLILTFIIILMVGHGMDEFFKDWFIAHKLKEQYFDIPEKKPVGQELINEYCKQTNPVKEKECRMARKDIWLIFFSF